MQVKELHRLRKTIEVRPRYGETDQMGIVYHANYLVWFHEARDALLASLGVDATVVENLGFSFPIVESRCRHRSPAYYGELVLVSAAPVVDINIKSDFAKLCVRYRVCSKKMRRLIAEGETTNVITDRNGRMLMWLPECFAPLARCLREQQGKRPEE